MGFFRDAMNSYYYGKSGKGDFTEENLPTNRLQLFWEMLRIRFTALIKLNLIYMIPWIPAMLVILLGAINIYNAMAGAVAETELTAYINQSITLTLALLIPCVAITGPFTAGAAYVTRNWARDEHAFVWADFKDALKDNWKQALPVSILTSLMPCVGWVCWKFYGTMAATSGVMIVPQVLITMVLVVFAIAVTYVHPLIVTYELKLSDIFRNALLLALARAPHSIGIRVLHMLPVLIAAAVTFFVHPVWGLLGLSLYYVMFGFAFSRFITASFTNAVFDKFINPKIAGAQIGRGLGKVESYDDEEDEEDDEDEE